MSGELLVNIIHNYASLSTSILLWHHGFTDGYIVCATAWAMPCTVLRAVHACIQQMPGALTDLTR
jgi:hypothetical protein